MAGPEGAPHPPETGEVAGDRRGDVDAGVEILDPVDGNLVDSKAVALGEQQQLRVEEPAVVDDEWQQSLHDVTTARLEPTLGVGEARAEAEVDQRL